jgi:hypothetical protein
VENRLVAAAPLHPAGDETQALARNRDPFATTVRAIASERDGVRSATR